jgi:hypothetical protein
MEFTIIWIVFIAMLAFLGFFLMRRFSAIKQNQRLQNERYLELQDKYNHLTSEVFDDVPVEELAHAVLFHIKAKEDRLYEGEVIDFELFDVLSEGEKMIYTITQVEASMNGSRGSIHSFFIDEKYEPYRAYVEPAFSNIHCFEIAELMKAAARLSQIIEDDLEDDENDLEGDYASYNFADYTQELLSLLRSSGILEKAGKYIQEHKEMFIETERSKEVGSEADEEGISE